MRVLLLGGTGAMGSSLRRLLADRGDEVTVTTRRERAEEPGVAFVQGDAKDERFLGSTLGGGYEVVVDFMTWTPEQFSRVMPLVLGGTGQYVFLSSYRVFAPADVITEESPRLADVCADEAYRNGDEYAIVKAREEDALTGSGQSNWTIVRPAITYSRVGRFQLGTYESELWLWRALHRLAVPFPREIAERECTLSKGEDVARMIAALVGNGRARGEAYNVSTAKHQPWGELLELYRGIVPFDVAWVGLGEYESHVGRALKRYGYVPQVRYDRAVDRVLDNSKILSATGIHEDELSGIEAGVASELGLYLQAAGASGVCTSPVVQGRLDRISSTPLPLGRLRCDYGFGARAIAGYCAGRVGLG